MIGLNVRLDITIDALTRLRDQLAVLVRDGVHVPGGHPLLTSDRVECAGALDRLGTDLVARRDAAMRLDFNDVERARVGHLGINIAAARRTAATLRDKPETITANVVSGWIKWWRGVLAWLDAAETTAE